LYSVYILIRPISTINRCTVLHKANSLSPPEIFLFYPGTWGNYFTNPPGRICLTYHDLLFHERLESTANSTKRYAIIPFFITKFERKIKNQRNTGYPGPNQIDMVCLNTSTVTFPKVGFYDRGSIRIKSGAQRREAILTGFFCMVI